MVIEWISDFLISCQGSLLTRMMEYPGAASPVSVSGYDMPYSEKACAIQRRASVHSMSDVEVGIKFSVAPAPSSYMSTLIFTSLLLFPWVYEYLDSCSENDVTDGSTFSVSCSITAVVESSYPPSAVLLH